MEDNSTPRPAQAAENQSLAHQPAEVNPEVQPVTETPSWTPDTDTDEDGSTSRRVSKKWIILGGILFVFLAAAVFLGAQLLKPPTSAEGENGGGPGLIMMGGNGGPGGAKSVRIEMTPAADLPPGEPDTAGLFVRREDQSLYIGTGNVRMTAKKQAGSSAPDDISSSYDGPVLEVVVNHETRVYQDMTEMTPPNKADNNGVVAMQQVVKPGSLDDISKNTMVMVWGEKRGDRYIAKTIVFR